MVQEEAYPPAELPTSKVEAMELHRLCVNALERQEDMPGCSSQVCTALTEATDSQLGRVKGHQPDCFRNHWMN